MYKKKTKVSWMGCFDQNIPFGFSTFNNFTSLISGKICCNITLVLVILSQGSNFATSVTMMKFLKSNLCSFNHDFFLFPSFSPNNL
jgi:hypothetical protein